MRCLSALVLSLVLLSALSSPALAQCGPDAAPPQAAAAGFTCETFRWGPAVGATPADTIAGIDTTQSGVAPGKKWFLGTNVANGYVASPSDFTVSGTGQIIMIVHTTPPGGFVLNTCFAPAGHGWTGGQFFQHGYYVEFVGEWNMPMSTSAAFYSTSLNWGDGAFPACNGQPCFELNEPEINGASQTVVFWGTGSYQAIPNNGSPIQAPTVETGTDRWGALVTASATTWWLNDVANGSVNYPTPFINPVDLYNSEQCFGLGSSLVGYPLTTDSVKIWQAGGGPPPSGFGGGRGLRR
jgi:hypothetical protein